LAVLLLYCVALTTFAVFALGYASLHADMTEAWAWGKEFQLGYIKHPPFAPWIAGLWFAVMPKADWSFYLLASINAALGLVGVWRLASLFVLPFGRWAVVLMAVLTPSFTIWALKFNANAPLLSTWPWAAYFFVQSLQTRRIGVSVLTGVLGAAALLTKYSSVVLFATFFLTALAHPDRRRYFHSSAPYVTILTGLVLISPHVWWMVGTGFSTIDYAISKTQYSVESAQGRTLTAVAGSIAGLGLAAGATALAFGARIWPLLRSAAVALGDRSVAWVAILALAPFLLTLAGHFVANLRISGGFFIPVFFALSIAFLVLSRAETTSTVVRRLAVCVVVIWLPLLLASPLLGYHSFTKGDASTAEPRSEVAIAATKVWRAAIGRRLRYVSGTEPMATAATFYSPDAPSYVMLDRPVGSRWAGADAISRDGLLIICRAADTVCIEEAKRSAGTDALRYADTFARTYFGRVGKPQRFFFFLLPPRDVGVVWD
jgi:4-amino-4-deoxy-L-arabinose transferase-like glycosyltransferase